MTGFLKVKKGKSEKLENYLVTRSGCHLAPRIRRGALVGVLLALAMMSACRGNSGPVSNASNSSAVPMRVVTDDLGRTATVPVRITRIVSLAPNLTENIYAVGAGDRLVGVTTFCNYPEQAKEVAKIGDTMTPNMESIIALKPDIVLVSTASQIEAFMKTLEQNGIAVYVTNPTSLDGVMKNLKQLGDLLGTQGQADRLVADLQRRVDAANPPAEYQIMPHPKVFVQISKEPLFTIGKQSFLTELVARAGGYSVTAEIDSAYPKISKETASALNPEAIILSDSEDNKEPNEVFKKSLAVKNGRIYKVNADILSRPGPRLVDALEQIAKDLHPEKFN